ncbi:hypothetical protein [Afipia sp. Root123D2]|uniref:hypothetical protein n=1 Tax=Afipia sp. Root123D2 TaxID=1736436 RepID=UPI0012E987E8|nr:hypothetical protein [Afipia sp. Root123D2]
MTQHISPNSLKLIDDAPRVMDLDLGDALGFAEPIDVRKLIRRNVEELEDHGEVFAMVAKTSAAGGRPGEEYWLNEPQSLLICMFARTDRAAVVRAEVIRVFMEWRAQRAPKPAPEALAEFPAADGPLNEHLAKIATLRECRLIHGPRAAARLWRRLGLPQVYESQIEELDDGRACLTHLLSARVDANSVRGQPMFTLLDSAINGNDVDQLMCKGFGVAAANIGGNEGFLVANSHPWLTGLYAGTQWADGGWRPSLIKIAGAIPSQRAMFAGRQQRAVFLPVLMIDTFVDRPPVGLPAVA